MTLVPDARHRLPPPARGRHAPAAWTLLAAAAALSLFWPGLVDLAREWSQPEFRLGPVAALLAAWLFLQTAEPTTASRAPDAWALLAVALLVAAAGRLLNITDLLYYALVAWVAGLALVHGIRLWPWAVALALTLPPPRFVYLRLQPRFDRLGPELAARLDLAPTPAGIGGIEVDGAVPLGSLLPIMAIALFLAAAFRLGRRQSIGLVLVAVPVVLAVNAFRAMVAGFLPRAEATLAWSGGPLAALGAVIFLILVAAAMTLCSAPAGERARRPLRQLSPAPSVALIAVALSTAAVSALAALSPGRPAVQFERADFSRFPPEIGGWSGSSVALTAGVESVLQADDYISASYLHAAEAAPVELFSAFYGTQSRGMSIHSPEICLPNDGWTIRELSATDLALGGAQAIAVNRAIIEKGTRTDIAYYWFEGRGRRTAGELAARLALRWDGLASGRTDGALVRVVTPILPGEGEAAADSRLRRFLAVALDRLPRFIPE